MRRSLLPFLRPVLVSFVLATATCGYAASAGEPRATYDFNPSWKLHVGDPEGAQDAGFDDSGWKAVTLPHAWNEDDAFKKAINRVATGIAWYRKSFKLPADSAGKKVYLEFEGVRQAGEFFLNGERIGLREDGISAFGFDITDRVRPAPEVNVIAVRTDNSYNYREKASGTGFQWNHTSFNVSYGGLYRNARLHVVDRLHQTLPLYTSLGTTGVYVYAREFDIPGRTATVTAESQVRNDHTQPRTFSYDVALEDMDGRVVKTFSAPATTLAPGAVTVVRAAARVTGLHFWSWGYGYLYNAVTTLKIDGQPVDVVRTRTGFRKTEFAKGMVKLNDRAIQMHGYAQRTSNEWPAVGASVPPWLSDYSNRLMVESGGNLVRWMHITPWKQDVDSCDRVGLIQAAPAGDSEADRTGRQWEQRVEVMRDAIVYHRNSPSIFFWEAGNKGVSEEHMAEMKAVRDQFDPHGGRAAGSREMLGSKVAEFGGEMLYINKSARIPFWQMEYSRDEGLRKYWDEFSPPYHKDGDGPDYRNAPARDYNRNQDSHAIENVVRWHEYWRERPGTGMRVNGGGVNIIFSDTNTHSRGAENYRRSGEVDAMRIPKDGFWAHQVMWDGWVDVERPRVHLIGHWNYKPETTKNVYAVSSADKVELFLNGRSLGFGRQSERFLFTFENVTWQPGTLSAVGYDAKGGKLCRAELKTAGEPAAVRLKQIERPQPFRADGADLTLVEVEVVDAQGNRCPTALHEIAFELNGPAEWRGGIAQGPDNHVLSKTLPVECGVNRVLLRSQPTAGKITLSAKAAGLTPAALELESVPVRVVDGLGDVLPGMKLPSNLARGATPATPSFVVSRLAVMPVRATAGANVERVELSYDDNEETAWANDNNVTTGWIAYEFAEPTTIDEVTFKLTGWRQRSYPLRITVDGQEVYRGVTPRTLGYCTLPLKPVNGQTMKVELVDGATNKDAFGGISELQARENASTGADKLKAGTLSIVEAEFYRRL